MASPSDGEFIDDCLKATRRVLAVQKKVKAKIRGARQNLKETLSQKNFEYMIWQEWKEGFARYIENHLRRILKLKLNKSGAISPYDRRIFYYGGAGLIEFLTANDRGLVINIKELFHKIMDI